MGACKLLASPCSSERTDCTTKFGSSLHSTLIFSKSQSWIYATELCLSSRRTSSVSHLIRETLSFCRKGDVHHINTTLQLIFFFIFVGIREEFINKMLVLDNMSKIFCPSYKQKGEKPSSVKDWKFSISSLITLQLKNLSVSSSTCMSNSISTTDVDFFSRLITQDWRFAGSSVSFLNIFYAILSG